MRYNYDKKGISDLVIAVLLVLFVITISGVAFNWIKGQTRSNGKIYI